MYDTLYHGIKGVVESKNREGDQVVVKGWTFSETHGVCPLRCQYDSILRGVNIETRKDICELFQKNNLILSGWNVRVPVGKYVDLQMKRGAEWITVLSFPTHDVVTETPLANETPLAKEPVPNNNIVLVESTSSPEWNPNKQTTYPKELEHFIQESLQDFLKKNPQASLSNTSVSLVNFSANPVHLSNVYVIDNYYQHPDDIRNVALSYITHQKMSHYIKDVPAFQKHFEKIIGAKIKSFSQYQENGTFSYTTSKDIPVLEKKGSQYAGVLFLTPDAPSDTGITLYDAGGKSTNTIANVYNRLVIFNTKSLPSITRSFGDSLSTGRLIQVFAFDLDEPEVAGR